MSVHLKSQQIAGTSEDVKTPKQEKFFTADNQQRIAKAYVYGVYFGDGCVTTRRINIDGTVNKCFVLQTIDVDFRDYTAEMLTIAYPTNRLPYKNSITKLFKDRRGNKTSTLHNVRLGLIGTEIQEETQNKALIPLWISEDHLESYFLEGFMDSEGWVTMRTHLKRGYLFLQVGVQAKGDFMFQVEKAFHRANIITTPCRVYGNGVKSIHINTQSWLDSGLRFHIKRKQARVDAYRAARNVAATFNDLTWEMKERLLSL